MSVADGTRELPRLFSDEDPDETRRRLGEIFERRPFLREKGWWQRFLDWLNSLFDDQKIDTPKASGGNWLGSLGNLVIWLVIVALAAALVVLVIFVVRGRVKGTKRRKVKPDVTLSEPELTVRQWRSLAERYEAAGEWKEAMRCRYRELVAELADRRSVSSVPGRTTGELRIDVAESSPDVAGAFDAATLLFELPWYADHPTGPAENARYRELASSVLEGARSGHFERGELVVVAGDDDDGDADADADDVSGQDPAPIPGESAGVGS